MSSSLGEGMKGTKYKRNSNQWGNSMGKSEVTKNLKLRLLSEDTPAKSLCLKYDLTSLPMSIYWFLQSLGKCPKFPSRWLGNSLKEVQLIRADLRLHTQSISLAHQGQPTSQKKKKWILDNLARANTSSTALNLVWKNRTSKQNGNEAYAIYKRLPQREKNASAFT